MSLSQTSDEICGDQNGDKQVNIFDVIIDLQIVVGLIDPTDEQKRLSDVVRNGAIDIFDVILSLQHIVGLTTITECGPAFVTRDFSLEAAPGSATVIQGHSTSYSVSANGTAGFSDLITLSVTGLPAGVTGSFSPRMITAGQRASLNISAVADAEATFAEVRVVGEAIIDTAMITKSVPASLTVEAAGQTGFLGRVLLVDGTPLAGVRLTLDGVTVSTDAGGNFLMLGVPEGQQMVSVDATPADPSYPIYGIEVFLIAGDVTQVPSLQITPPPPPEAFTAIDNANNDQVVTDPRYPGFSVTLLQGATVMGWDGKIKDKIGVNRLMPDQLPVPPPDFATNSLYQISFGTPMGGLPSDPLPVSLPNDQDADPGEKVEIWYYDAAPIEGAEAGWKLAGLGTVSEDGTSVFSDPGVGLSRFCGVCGLACFKRLQEKLKNKLLEAISAGDPVDLYLGEMIVEKTDLVLPGRLPVAIQRTYNPIDPYAGITGFQLGFGPGWSLPADVALQEETPALRRLILPGNSRIAFTRQTDDTFVNDHSPQFLGAVLSSESGGGYLLRFKDGSDWRFAPGPVVAMLLLSEQRDRSGNQVTIERDSAGRITRLVEPSGRALVFTVSSGRTTRVQDPAGRTVQYSYNAAGRLETVTDPAGGTTRYPYNSVGQILTITDAKGIVYIQNEHSPGSGRVLKQTQADSSIWLFRYELQGARVTGPGCPGLSCPTEESADLVALGFRFIGGTVLTTTVVDGRDQRTRYRYNNIGHVTELTNALGQVTRFERDTVSNLPLSVTDPLGRRTRLTYDARGNVTSITDPAGNISRFEYEPIFNHVTRTTDPLGNTANFAYDGLGNLTRATDPLGNSTSITYNTFGQPVSTTDPLGNVTTFSYDVQGNLAKATDPLGNASRLSYDLVSRLIAQTDPRGRTSRFAYNSLGQMTRITDAVGEDTTFSYDPNGNLLSVTDALDHATNYAYDAMDRVSRRTDPVGVAESFLYDAKGNLTGSTDRKGQAASATYDALDRPSSITYGDGTTTAFIYDAAGRPVQITDSVGGTVLNQYDSLDRLVAQTTTLGTVQYQYDVLGRRTQMSATGQPPVSYSYDAASRLTRITQGTQVVQFQYDALGRRTRLTLPNGVSTEYHYDAASRLTELVYHNGTGLLGNLTYEYDAAGSRNGVGGSLAPTALPDQVSGAAYDAANRQTQFADQDMTFDANGNLISRTDAAGITTYTWDARNRLLAISGPSLTASFTYDALGRRSAKTINGQRTQYLYDGADIIQELGPGGPVSYRHGPAVDEPLVRGGGEYYLADALGSIIALTDSSGNIQTSYTYQAFGRTNTAGAPSGNPFQYTARENDGTGLYYYRARYYSPELGRFINEDPIGLVGGMNVYAYVGNNPISSIDPLGLVTWGGGFHLEAGFIFGASVTVALVADANGNVGIAVTGGLGVYTPGKSASFQLQGQQSSADDITQLNGVGVSLGSNYGWVPVPVGPVAAGSQFFGKGYQGQTFAIGVGTPGYGRSTEITNTRVLGVFNIFDLAHSVSGYATVSYMMFSTGLEQMYARGSRGMWEMYSWATTGRGSII